MKTTKLNAKDLLKIDAFLKESDLQIFNHAWETVTTDDNEMSEGNKGNINNLNVKQTDLFILFNEYGAYEMELLHGDADIDNEFGLLTPKTLCLVKILHKHGARRNRTYHSTLIAIKPINKNKSVKDFVSKIEIGKRNTLDYSDKCYLKDGRVVELFGGNSQIGTNFHHHRIVNV